MSQLGLDNNDCTMSDIFTKMIQDNDSVLYLNVSNNIVVTDLPINSSGELFIVQSQKGRNFALYTENYAASTNNPRMWFGVFAWSPVSFQGWHQILANQNPCAEWALQDGYIAQLDRSGSNWQDLCIKLIKDDSTVYMPLIQNLKRSYALSSELPPINIYHKLISLGFSDAVSLEDIYNKLPEHSYFFCSTEGADTITNLPDNATYGILEIYRSGRNFARFTPSLSTGTSDSMYYGTFTWSGSVKFNGWRRIIGTDRLANNLTTTATEYALDARQGKALNDKITSMQSSFQAGVDTLYNKCVSCGSTPSNKTPTAISNSIQSIYNNRYSSGRNDVYKTSKTTTGYGNLAISVTSKPSSGTYTVDENTFNIPIKNKFLHKITCNLVHRVSSSYTDASAFTSGMQIIISTVEGTTLYSAYVHKTNPNDTVLMDGKTYNYSWEFDTLDYIINTSHDYIKFYARCFLRMQYASYVNSINMTYQINNITANYH